MIIGAQGQIIEERGYWKEEGKEEELAGRCQILTAPLHPQFTTKIE
jgi:hypothetical protein